MARVVMRKFALAAGLLAAVAAAPLGAQMFSGGYEFLKAVKDRDGEAVTEALNEPGTTIVNTRDITSGETALHVVTARRDTNWIRFLTQRGANPNIRDKNGVSPLQLAVQLGYVEGVEALLKSGADIDVTDSAGETPLIAAVHRRDVPLIRILLANGANPDSTDNSGRTARDYVMLLPSNGSILGEFERADEKREAQGAVKNYGPSI